MGIEELLIQFNINPQNRRIRDFYEAENLWRTLGIERDEKSHSAFIVWLLGVEPAKENSPLHNFLNLLVGSEKYNNLQQNTEGYNELKKSVLLGNLRLLSVQIETEKTVSSLSKIRYNDRLDIYAISDIEGAEKYKKLEIIIENKINSSEGGNKFKNLSNETQEEKNYKTKAQTERYYYACSEEHQLRNSPICDTIQLFVFLTAQKDQEPADNHYIKISYQDLVNFIIEPLLNREDIDNHTIFVLREYLRILGNPCNNQITMATTNEEKELLKEFYNRNEELFKRALEVMRDEAMSDEEKEQYQEMIEAISVRKGIRRFFKINGNGKYKMYEVLAEFAKYLLTQGKNLNDIETLIKKYTQEPNRNHISSNKGEVFRFDKHYHEAQDTKGNILFYVTKEWGLGNNGKNFSGILTNINNNYSDFRIEEIKD